VGPGYRPWGARGGGGGGGGGTRGGGGRCSISWSWWWWCLVALTLQTALPTRVQYLVVVVVVVVVVVLVVVVSGSPLLADSTADKGRTSGCSLVTYFHEAIMVRQSHQAPPPPTHTPPPNLKGPSRYNGIGWQVAVGKDGRVYVSDGYCASRVAQFSAEGAHLGDYVLEEGAMGVPHSVALAECKDRLMVADRENSRVHQFELSSRKFAGRDAVCLPCLCWPTARHSK